MKCFLILEVITDCGNCLKHANCFTSTSREKGVFCEGFHTGHAELTSCVSANDNVFLAIPISLNNLAQFYINLFNKAMILCVGSLML